MNKEIIKNNNPYIHNNHASKVFKILIYTYEFIEDENKYRLLYNFNSEDNFYLIV